MTNEIRSGISGWESKLLEAGLDGATETLKAADHTKRQTWEYIRMLQRLGLPTHRLITANAGEFFNDLDGWFDALDTNNYLTDKYFIAVEEPATRWRTRLMNLSRGEATRFAFGTLRDRGQNVFARHEVFLRQYFPTKYHGEFWIGPSYEVAGVMESTDGAKSISFSSEINDYRFRYSRDDPRLRGLAFWAVHSVLSCGQKFPLGTYQYIFDGQGPGNPLSLKFLDYFPDDPLLTTAKAEPTHRIL
jgi:hypothetical protein